MGSTAHRVLGLLALPLLLAAGPSGTEVPDALTPEGAVALALEQHPSLRASQGALEASLAEHRLARSGYLPRITLGQEAVRSTNPVFVFAAKLGQQRFGPQDFDVAALNRPDPWTDVVTRVQLRQSVWDAGRTPLALRAAAHGVEAAGAAERRGRREVAFGALRAFWDAVLAERMVEVAERAERAAEENLRLADEQVAAGLGVPSDRMSAEVRLAEVRALRIRARQGERVARAALNAALGIDGAREFALEPPEPAPASPVDPERELREALERRADLIAAEQRMRQAAQGVRLARAGRLPVIGAGASWESHGSSWPGDRGDNWSVALSLSVPLFDGGETRARVARARAEGRRAQAMRDALEQGIRVQVRAACADVTAASENARVAEAALEHAQEALRIVRERYAEGLAVIVELLGAEAALTGAEANHVRAARDLALAGAGLDLATGAPGFAPASDPGRETHP